MITLYIHNLEEVGKRLDHYLVSNLDDHSRSQIQSWIRSGSILVNDRSVKTGYSLELNDQILINPPKVEDSGEELIAEQIKLDILFEDDQIVVINKPAGMVVHPGTGVHKGTLVNGLIHYFKNLSNLNGKNRPGIVHRLDKDTSGIILVAKTNKAHAYLSEQFKNRKVIKEYTGLTWGKWTNNNGKIDAPIGRDRKDHTKYTISENGKKSFTDYKVENQFRHCTLVSFFPKTGRTHQIRVHASHVGHPIFGDEKYGGGISKTKGFLPEFTQFYKKKMSQFNRHALHASSLEVSHPINKEPIFFKAPLPIEYLNLIEAIDGSYNE